MTIATFSDLQAALQDEMGRSDLSTARAELLCSQVEADLNNNRDFKPVDLLTTASVATVTGIATVTLNASVKWVQRVWLDNDSPSLTYVTPAQIVSLYNQVTLAQPIYYSLESNGVMRFAPVPDGVYTVNYTYGSVITPLRSATPTNWLLTKHPLIYLYGAAYYNYMKLKDFNQVQAYRDLYYAMVGGLISADDRYRYPMESPLVPIVRIDSEPY